MKSLIVVPHVVEKACPGCGAPCIGGRLCDQCSRADVLHEYQVLAIRAMQRAELPQNGKWTERVLCLFVVLLTFGFWADVIVRLTR